MKNTSLLWEERRGEKGGWDSYYSTPYKNIFIHLFVSIDKKMYYSAEKIIGDKIILRRIRRDILPILGGISSSFSISRQTFDDAMNDAKYLSRKMKESKDVGKMHYSNVELFNKIKNAIN